ncbi:MAG: hypothetical protein LKCHEGNO_00263 [Burkholderiaceae bacterium]|nr:hypothetical protein [Burkholderiaceae bacterium]
MSNQVYANNMEVSCKAAAGKSICAFPDVCFTPPQTPATPPGVPIPYPNTGMASDTTSGSTSVKISGKEVMLKNKSYFKKSMGDEAGCAPKKGLITSKNMGKVYFTAWSMDVKVEGENVVRMLDLTTHNHGSVPGNTATWPYIDEVANPGITKVCEGMEHVMLVPKVPGCPKKNGQHQTPHHLIPGRCTKGKSGFNYDKAPCICVLGKNQHTGSHKACHRRFDKVERYHFEEGLPFNYSDAQAAACDSAGGAMDPPRDLNEKEKACVGAQLDAYYKQPKPDGPGLSSNSPVNKSGASGKVNDDYEAYRTAMKAGTW